MRSNSTDPGEIRKFGAIALIFFGSLSAVGFWLAKPLPAYLFLFLSTVAAGFILLPVKMAPVYMGWMKTARLIGSTVTLLMLTVIFYLVITPSALIKRILGGRPLPIRPDKKASTYWVTRTEPAQPIERYYKRF